MSLFVLHLSACAFMTGLIWIIQILHYPAFNSIEAAHFSEFHRRHSRGISWIVAPAMSIELLTGIALVFSFSETLFWKINLLLIFLTWLSTALLSVPCHQILSAGKNLAQVQKLVRTNWPRTCVWSIRLGLLLQWILGGHHVSFV